jgi:predicted ATPase/DNA-binding SARP family transcriptional activator
LKFPDYGAILCKAKGLGMLEIRLIGTFNIISDGKPVIISSRAAQSLFAYLILSAGTLHRREKLAGMFWPDATEEKARAYLRHEIWRIRKALSTKSRANYLFADDINISFSAAAEHWLDVTTLKNISENATAEELMNALSVFDGELLPGFYEDWIVLEREHLQAIYEQKIAGLLQLLESEKRWKDILDWAERWILLGQGPEAAYRALMSAYDAMGDRAKVASTYKRCVHSLRELDLEPSEQTRALAFQWSSKLSIPIPLTSFIGREQELKEVAALLSKSRLVTLTGSGGVGKTRLAIQVIAEALEQFPDGVWFLDLAPLSDPVLVPNTLAHLLGLRESSDTKLSFTDLLINYFSSRTALVVFNNCEHLIKSCAQLVNSLLISCENLSILATSREALRVSGETPYRVPSLELPMLDTESTVEAIANIESVRLFIERAAVVSPGFVIGAQNALIIAQICQRLDGIPLAIELAAGRTSLLAVEQILKRLDDRFNLLTGGLRTALPRHQTLRATIEWSYDLLSEQERLLFRRLAVFMGGWTLEASEEVCAEDSIESTDILDLLAQLISKSLVWVDISDSGETRYRRLETIRQFGREKLFETAEATPLQDRHLAYFMDLAEQADKEIHGPNQIEWMDRLEKEIDNFRSALGWCMSEQNTESVLRLLSMLGWTWGWRGHFVETSIWFDKIRALPDVSDYPALYATLLNYMGQESWWLGDFSHARSVLEESQAIWMKLGADGERGLADALECLGNVSLFHEADIKTAQSSFEQCFELYQRYGDQRGMTWAMLDLGSVAFVQGHHARAEEQFMKGLAKFQELGDKFSVAYILTGLGELTRFLGDYERADKFYEQNLKIYRELGIRFSLAWPLLGLAWVSLHKNDYHKAKALFVESIKLSMEDGNKSVIALCLAGFASIFGMTSKPEQAVRLFGAVKFSLESIGRPADRKDFDYYVEAVRTQLHETAFAEAWAGGQAMTLEQAVDYALREL